VRGELSGGICDPNFRGASEKRREVEAEQKSIEKKNVGHSHMFIDLPWMYKGD
jgi:hypothetical protein